MAKTKITKQKYPKQSIKKKNKRERERISLELLITFLCQYKGIFHSKVFQFKSTHKCNLQNFLLNRDSKVSSTEMKQHRNTTSPHIVIILFPLKIDF